MIGLLSQVAPASLTNEDFVIPSLSIAMMGNGRYTLPEEFHSAFDLVFDTLNQTPVERIS